MREILFRGKRVDNGEWVEGFLSNATITSEDKEPYIGMIIDRVIEYPFETGWLEIIPETVGQFTGLTDKNGKKIFEGDIVKVEGSRHVYEVRWNETLTGYWYYRSGCFFSMLTSNCEVIGTIYDVGIKK